MGGPDVFRLDTIWPGWTALHLAAAHGLEEAGLPWISMRHMDRVLRVLGCSLQPKKRWEMFKLSCLRIEMLKLQNHGI